MGTQCPGVIAGPPCPGDYKYGGVGPPGWGLGDRLTTCHRQKSVRKPKLWPRKSQTKWTQPRQWKRIKEMRIAAWNVCT